MEDFLTPDFTAQLTYFTEREGGRNTPLSNGHRVMIDFSGIVQDGRAEHQFDDIEEIYAGDILEGQVCLVDAESFFGKLYRGLDFTFSVNDQAIGSGVILRIENEDLSA